MGIFIDACFLLAYYNSDDENHSKAVELMKEILDFRYGSFFISDYVFDEFSTILFKKTNNLEKAVFLCKKILDSELGLLFLNEMVFSKAWQLMQKGNELSFTDCVIIELMKEHKIKYLASFDSGFLRIKEIILLR